MERSLRHQHRGWRSVVALCIISGLLFIAACGSEHTVDATDPSNPDAPGNPAGLSNEVLDIGNSVDPDREFSFIVYWEASDAQSAIEAVRQAGGRVVAVVDQLGYLVAAFEGKSAETMEAIKTQLESNGLVVKKDIVSKDPTTG